MCKRDVEFLRYYNEYRIDDQKDFYHRKSGWNERRANFLIVAAGIVMLLTSGSSFAATQFTDDAKVFQVFATIMPAFSGAIVAIRGLFEYERNHTRYSNTLFDLKTAAVELRPGEALTAAELRAATGLYVSEIENLLSRENRQWSLMVIAASATEGERRRL